MVVAGPTAWRRHALCHAMQFEALGRLLRVDLQSPFIKTISYYTARGSLAQYEQAN